MKRKTFCILLISGSLLICVLGLSFSILAEEIPSAKVPHISISEELWDIGTIPQGEMAIHTFVIKNTGDADLIINKVRPSCGCLATFAFNPNILAGSTSELKVSFDSKGEKDNFEKYIYIDSNDPDAPNKVITIRGTVKILPKISISVEPTTWDFASAALEQPSTFQFAIENKGNVPLKVSSIETSSNSIDVSISSADIEPHRVTSVTTTLKPRTKAEEKEGYISLKVDIPIQYPRQ